MTRPLISPQLLVVLLWLVLLLLLICLPLVLQCTWQRLEQRMSYRGVVVDVNAVAVLLDGRHGRHRLITVRITFLT